MSTHKFSSAPPPFRFRDYMLTLFLMLTCGTSAFVTACHTVKRTAVANTPSEPALNVGEAARLSKISGEAEALEHVVNTMSPSVIKAALWGPISVIRSLAGPASVIDSTAALGRVNQALSGELSKAKAGWEKEKLDAKALLDRIAALEAQVKDERETAVRELNNQLDDERKKAKADHDTLVLWILYGGGAALVALGVVVLCLASQVPMFGPRAALGLASAGVVLLMLGRFMQELQEHPTLFWIGVGLSGAAVLATAIYIHGNHLHDQAAKSTNTPAK